MEGTSPKPSLELQQQYDSPERKLLQRESGEKLDTFLQKLGLDKLAETGKEKAMQAVLEAHIMVSKSPDIYRRELESFKQNPGSYLPPESLRFVSFSPEVIQAIMDGHSGREELAEEIGRGDVDVIKNRLYNANGTDHIAFDERFVVPKFKQFMEDEGYTDISVKLTPTGEGQYSATVSFVARDGQTYTLEGGDGDFDSPAVSYYPSREQLQSKSLTDKELRSFAQQYSVDMAEVYMDWIKRSLANEQ